MTRRGWVLFAAMCLIWGLPYLFIRVAVEDLNPGTMVFLRTAGAAALLLPAAAGRGMLRPVLSHWRPIIAFSLIEVVVPWVLLSDAERRLTSSLAGLLVAAVPLIGAALAFFSSHGDRMGARQLAGLAVGIVGVTCLVGLDLGQLHLGAMAEMLVVSIGYATGPVILARWLADLPGLGVIAAAMTVSTVLLLPFPLVRPPEQVAGRAIVSIAVLSLVCTALAFVLFFQLIAEIGPTRCTVITYVNPAVAVLLGVLVLGEHLTVGMVVGFPLILAGSVLATRSCLPGGGLRWRRRAGQRPAHAPAADALEHQPVAESSH
ncbi:MAG TPA: DMT family transporter [Jatrophihabitans sp.]|nr:DMT family transporter [Jatrophihabitans sp.]